MTLCERGERLGNKLRLTGKGRCNITNDCSTPELIENIPGNGRFLYSAFSQFDARDCQEFFRQAGLPLKVERGQRVFPVSDKAEDVVKILQKLMREAGVNVLYKARVMQVIFSRDANNDRVVRGVKLAKQIIEADAVILATGGASYPLTGSTGDGYSLAAGIGHYIETPRGALVPQETVESWPATLQGLALKNVRLSLFREESKLGEEFGEMLFTHFGVSGPIVLTLSRLLLDDTAKHHLVLNLKPALSEEQLDLRLQRDLAKNSRKMLSHSLDELLPKRLAPIIIEYAGLDPVKSSNSITRSERRQLARALTHLVINIAKPRPIAEAIVTAGGVRTKEVDPKTMASKLCQGLYIIGELLDVDGYTGGFNLQAAFAMGYVAGKSAAIV